MASFFILLYLCFIILLYMWCGYKITMLLKWIMFLFSVVIMLSVNMEQCVNVKFCVKLGKCATETYDLLKKFYGGEWYTSLSSLKGVKRQGKRSEMISAPVVPAHQKQTVTSKKVGEIVRQNCCLSIRAVAELINIERKLFDRFYITIST